MIAQLKGLVAASSEGSAIIDVAGVGYRIHASARTLDKLPSVGEAVLVHVETQVREDAITLYGFMDPDERALFTLLTSVQGVGARVALAILSVAPPGDMQTAIMAGDKAVVAQASGVGPKLAARIINELKDRVAAVAVMPALADAKAARVAPGTVSGDPSGDRRLGDIVSALTNLGYRPAEAHQAAARALAEAGEGASLSTLIPAALKLLAPSS